MGVPPVPERRSEFIWFDGDFVGWDEAQIHVLSHVLHYGSSVFEGIRCYDTEEGPGIFRLRDHLDRLLYSAKIMRMEIPYTVDELSKISVEMVRRNGMSSCYLRPLAFRGAGGMGLLPTSCPVHLMIASWPWGAYLGEDGLEKGIDVMVSSWRKIPVGTIPPLAKIGGAYVLASLAKMEATRLGFTEALLMDTEGRVAEGSGENLFAVAGGSLITPPLSSSILGGITRRTVVALARDRGIPVEEQALTRGALHLAEELFFTGTAAEITPIRSVDALPVGNGSVGPVTRALQDEFFAIVKGTTSDRHRWLTSVSGATASS